MPGTCVIGLQWGDEAKGKLVDLLTPGVEIVVRYQGGANAGHTVVTGDEGYKLHHLPSGILHAGVTNIVSTGVVINPPTILEEIDGLQARGIPVQERLLISDRAHVVFPWHMAEDRVLNARLIAGESIGTTLRGIGPCYRDKVGRSLAIRLGDMLRDDFPDRVRQVVAAKRQILEGIGGALEPGELDADEVSVAIREGALLRVRPKAMTVAVILAGLFPILIGTGAGSEVMSRIAAPMIGGMITAPLLSMFVLPAAYLMMRRPRTIRSKSPEGEEECVSQPS